MTLVSAPLPLGPSNFIAFSPAYSIHSSSVRCQYAPGCIGSVDRDRGLELLLTTCLLALEKPKIVGVDGVTHLSIGRIGHFAPRFGLLGIDPG